MEVGTNDERADGRLAHKVLLIGWDGADWKMIEPLVERGLMPNTARFIEQGVMGNVASLTPMLSPILWTSIATGKFADKHQILGFAEPDGATGGIRPVTSTSRQCKAIWNILSERGMKVGAVNWFASHPAEGVNGFVISDRFAPAVAPRDQKWPKVPHSVHPPELLDAACETRIHPADTTPQQMAPFIPRLGELDPREDRNLQTLRTLLAQCATVHAVTTRFMVEREWDFLGVYYDTIDRCAHAFMEYHPPKMEHVSDEDYERYKDVMTACYRFHDMMLGRMVQLAGDDATIIILSDHGFHCDHLRPKGTSKIQDGRPVEWHRTHGVLAIRGPGIKRDERIYGASLLDITPTILWLLGCPVARDMDGRPLTQIRTQADAPPVDTVDTYENGAEPEIAVAAADYDDPWVAQQMLAHLAEMGYIDNDDTESVVIDRARNLGQVYAGTGRFEQALEQFENIQTKKPDDAGKLAIASCLLNLGRLEECERIVDELLGGEGDAARANLFKGMIRFRTGDTDAALDFLRKAEAAEPDMPGLYCQIGNVYLRRRRWDDAATAYRRALEIDPNNAEAHDGLGVVHRQQQEPAQAVREHMEAIALLYYRPQTHINLGMALAQVGQLDWAIRAFNIAGEMDPRDPLPHRCLAEVYDRVRGDQQLALTHRRKADALHEARTAAAVSE